MISRVAPTVATCTGVTLAGSVLPESNTTLILQLAVIAFNVISEIVKHRKINKKVKNEK